MPLWAQDRHLPRGVMGAAQNSGDGTYGTGGAVACYFSVALDPTRRYRLSSNHACTSDSAGNSGLPPSDVIFLSLVWDVAPPIPSSAELTSDTVTSDAFWNDQDEAAFRFLSFQYLLPPGWSGVYYFGAMLKVVTAVPGTTGETFYGQTGFKFLMVLEDIGAA